MAFLFDLLGSEVMPEYKALYRKWRPITFDDVVGQRHITDTLKHEIAEGKTGHAYLFCGTRGTGKTTTAKILARAVNCENPNGGEPCNKCATCRGIIDGNILDVYEMDAASNNGVDNIRDLRDEIAYSPAGCSYKVYIIDEAHMLTTAAFNALLKTLEEPPAHALFILATTEPQKIPQTILSRCQRYDFRRIGTDDIAARLKKVAAAESINATEDAIELIAELGDGSMRDALSILERCASFGGDELRTDDVSEIVGIADTTALFEISDCAAKGDTGGAVLRLDEIINAGKDVLNLFEELIAHFRAMLLCSECKHPEKVIEKSPEAIAKYKEAAKKFTAERLIYSITVLSEYHAKAKSMTSQGVAAEVAAVKLCNPSYSTEQDALIARIEKLERKISGVTVGVIEAGRAETRASDTGTEKALQSQMSDEPDAPPWDNEQESHTQSKSKAAKPQPAAGGGWKLWPEVLETIKDSSKMLYMYLYKCEVEERGNNIIIEVASKVAYDRVATPNGIKYLSELFSKLAGKPLSAKVYMQGESRENEVTTEDPEPAESQNGSIMDIVNKKDEFGDIINVKGE